MDEHHSPRYQPECRLHLGPFLEFLRYKKTQCCLNSRAAIDCRTREPDSWNPIVQEEIDRFADEGFNLDFHIDTHELKSSGRFRISVRTYSHQLWHPFTSPAR